MICFKSVCTANLDRLIVVRLTIFGFCRWRTPMRKFRAQEKNLKLWEREEYGRTEEPHFPRFLLPSLSPLPLFAACFRLMPFSMQKTANLAALPKRSSFIRLNLASPLSVFRLVLISYRWDLDLDTKVRPAEFYLHIFPHFLFLD